MTLEIPGVVRIERDAHGLPRFVITNAFAEAEVHVLGGQVTSFRPVGEEPVLWLSPLAAFAEGKAIRGGVPICWPWFGPHASRADFPAHGFARTRLWEPIEAASLPDGRARLRLGLSDDERTRALWPHAFALALTVTVGTTLELTLATTNTGDAPFTFTDALHAYLSVGDLHATRLLGLGGAPFIHSTQKHRGVQSGPITFDGSEVNHIHVPNRETVHLVDDARRRRIEIAKSGSLATVVWNPGEAGGTAMKDVGGHWNEFVCIEAATCADASIELRPGESHTTSQTLRVLRE